MSALTHEQSPQDLKELSRMDELGDRIWRLENLIPGLEGDDLTMIEKELAEARNEFQELHDRHFKKGGQ